jgi:SNF family Na+-dependent transporter
MSQKERWASRVGLVLAMAGNAVGLGNFLRFPAQAAANGGGAFLIPYFVALIVVGLPLIWVEWAMGRYGGQQGHHSAPGLFQAHSNNPFWKYFGVMGLWSCLVIAAFYLYIETWCIAYALYSFMGGFLNEDPGNFLGRLTGEKAYTFTAFSQWGMVFFGLCIALNVWILSRGLAKGIEIVCKIGMPLLILFAAILAVRGLFIDPSNDPKAVSSAWEGLNFVWQPRFESLGDPAVWVAAAGQIFFTLSIGMGSIHCYASYLREKDDIALTGQTAAWTNEFCEVILGGTILIPIAVAYLGLAQVESMTSGGSGFGLGFIVFPKLFNNWGDFGAIAGLMWFGLLFFAAITSSLAMGQPIMAFLQQEFGYSREKSALAFGAMLLPLALPVALLHSATFFDEFDYWAGTVMLVVFALGETILFAWIFGMDRGWTEITKGAEIKIPLMFKYLIRYVTPVFLLVILVTFIFKVTLNKETNEYEWADDGMIGKLLHRDVKNTLKKTLAGIDGRMAELTWSENERARQIDEAKAQITKTTNDETLRPDQRTKSIKELNEKISRFSADGKLDEEKRNLAISAEMEKREKAQDFYTHLPTWRNVDRLVMVGVYGFLCVLVWIAWTKRAKAQPPVTV